MPVLINYLLIAFLAIVAIIFLFMKLNNKKTAFASKKLDKKMYEINAIIEYVKKSINEMTNSNLYDQGLSELEFKRELQKRNELKSALKGANTGNSADKLYVKEFILDLLSKTYLENEEKTDLVIPFPQPKLLTIRDKFEILLHRYKKDFDDGALGEIIKKYDLDRLKDNGNEGQSYIITFTEINDIFEKEYQPLRFSYADKLQVITQRVFSMYRGFGVIDDIRDMKIDGVSGGVSGLPNVVKTIEDEHSVLNGMKSKPSGFESIWIMHKGKTIHLSFLSFETEAELRRVVQNIYKHNNPGQLSEARPYIVNSMSDGSRVVVVRPPFSESWAFFVRKFDLPMATVGSLVTHDNREVVINTFKFLMAGCRVTGITGAQGTGKTTMLMAMAKYIDPTLTIRPQEMAFELHLRKIYPERNILSFQETSSVSGQEGLDLQKKTDGAVNILGEVATDEVAAWMIQMSQVASLFTIFTHHAKTFESLIYSLRNSLLKTGTFSNEKIAEQQVISVINFEVHLSKNYRGERFIERITECIPLEQDEDYPREWSRATNAEERMQAFMTTMTEYFRRKTDRKTFEGRNIIEFRNGRYEVVNPISERQIREMNAHLSPELQKEFQSFLVKNQLQKGV